MTDVFSTEKRSGVMASIRSTDNKSTELRMIALLRAHGITGWRRRQPEFGKPDFVFPKQRLAIFIDGCFWHRHPGCRFSYTPKSRTDFWLPKFANNVARDRLVTRTLQGTGWRVLRVWECDLAAKRHSRCISRLRRMLGKGRSQS